MEHEIAPVKPGVKLNGTEVYPASQIKPKRFRATQDEMSTRRRRLIEIVEEDQPMTVRQVYYQAEVHGIVGKTDSDYDKSKTR